MLGKGIHSPKFYNVNNANKCVTKMFLLGNSRRNNFQFCLTQEQTHQPGSETHICSKHTKQILYDIGSQTQIILETYQG